MQQTPTRFTERLLMNVGRGIGWVGVALAVPGILLIDAGERIEQRGLLRRSLRRQRENKEANPGFVKATRID